MFTEIYQPKDCKYDFTVQQAQEMRQQVKELDKEYKRLEMERQQVKGQAKRPFTKRIKEIDAELDTLKAGLEQSPPEPMSNASAVNRMFIRLTEHVERYDEAKESAIKDIESGYACHNASWHFPKLFELEFKTRITNQILSHTIIFDIYTEMYSIYKDCLDKVLRSNNIHNSTCEMSNAANMIEHQSRLHMATGELVWWLHDCEFLIERVKVHQSLSETNKED